jgi:protein Mpv17
MSSQLKKIIKGYVNLLKTHPAITKTLTGAFFVGVGDSVAQKFVEGKSLKDGTYDKERTIRFATVALFFITPSTRYWVDVILPKFIKRPKNSKNLNFFALKKVAADALIFAPIISSMVLGGNMFFAFKYENSEILSAITSKVPGIILASWCWWPWNQFINFRFVPSHLQHIYIMAAAFVWNTYLSWRMNKEIRESEEQQKLEKDALD